MSKIYKKIFLAVALLKFFSASSALATEISLHLESQNGKSIELAIKNNTSRVAYDGETLKLDFESKKIFSSSNAISTISPRSFILDGGEFIWLFIRIPSRNSQGKGYCGAGTEDYLYLFNIKKKKFKKITQFRVQSCLKNLSIGIDELADIKESNKILLDQRTGTIEFTQEMVDDQKATSKKIKLYPTKLGITVQE